MLPESVRPSRSKRSVAKVDDALGGETERKRERKGKRGRARSTGVAPALYESGRWSECEGREGLLSERLGGQESVWLGVSTRGLRR